MRTKPILHLFMSVFLSASLVITAAGCNNDKSSNAENNKSTGGNSSTQDGKQSAGNSTAADSSADRNDEANSDLDWKGLLTKEDAESILGEPLGEPEYTDSDNPLGQKIIFWPVANELDMNYVELSFISTQGIKQQLRENGHDAKKQFESEKALLKDVEEVSGIGDAAYWDAKSPLISGLHVLKDDYCFTVMVNSNDKNSQLQAEKDQAKKILERLP